MKIKYWFSVYENLREEIEMLVIKSNNILNKTRIYNSSKLLSEYHNQKNFLNGYITALNTIFQSNYHFEINIENKNLIVVCVQNDKIIDKIKPL